MAGSCEVVVSSSAHIIASVGSISLFVPPDAPVLSLLSPRSARVRRRTSARFLMRSTSTVFNTSSHLPATSPRRPRAAAVTPTLNHSEKEDVREVLDAIYEIDEVRIKPSCCIHLCSQDMRSSTGLSWRPSLEEASSKLEPQWLDLSRNSRDSRSSLPDSHLLLLELLASDGSKAARVAESTAHHGTPQPEA